MNFSEWTKDKKRKNQQVDLQETTKEPLAAPAAKASSFAEWTRNQTAAKSEDAGQSRNAGPQSFSEWIRQNRGDSAWREEDVAVRQRNDYISDYSQRANREFSAQRNRYVAPETAAQRQTEAASQARAAKNAGTEILKTMRQSGRYSDEETRRALERLTAGDDVMEAIQKNAENDTAFRSQFQSEDQYNSWKKWQEYENLRNNPDFAEKSRYKSTANNSKPSVIDILADNYRADNSGWDDPLYEYVNGNQEAGAYLYNRANSIYGSGGNALGALYGNVADSKTEAVQITDDERALFNYIYATQGKDSAHEYYEAIQSGLNARQREQDMRALQEYAGARPVEASFLSVLESPLKGLSYIGQASDYLSGGSIDQNAGYNRFAYYGSSIRGKVSDTIANSGKWGKVGSFLYQTGMSMGDFLLNTALTGGFAVDGAAAPALAKGVEALSLAIMGTGAAADATIEAKDRGLTDTQAFTLGTIAGAAEIVTEKVSLETLLDKTTLGRDAVGYLLKNTLAEGSEEVASDFINLFADILVTKDKSQWNEAIQGYEAQGLSEKDAWWRAVLDQAEEMGVDFLGGALSGGVMAGAGIAINSGVNDYYARQNGRMILDADAVQDTIDSGLTMGKNTRAYQQARDLMARVSEGQDVSALQIGRLYGENVQALDAETKAGDLLLQAAREAAEHGTISNNRALDILDNPAALDTLISETGVEIREDMTRAQQRRAVKSAVEALASETTDISVPGNEPVTVNAESGQEAATAPVQAGTENRNPALQVFDGKQIAEAGKALGENGRKALTSTYAKVSDSMSGADYYEAFSQYYQAGVTGKTIAEVNSQVEISPAQQFAAYVSGQNDAAVAAAQEKTAAKYAKTAGDGSGLVYDAFVKEAVESGRTLENSRSAYLTAETAERVNAVSKALGLRAQFVDSVEGGIANAQIQGDTVLIEKNNPNPVMFLTGHEITHRIQELAPEQYRSFRKFISENDADFQAQVEAIQSLYESHGMEISYEKAMDEAAADYAGRLMEDGTLLDEFIQKNRKDKTLLEKVRDAIRSIIDVLTGREKQQAQTAEGKLTAALEAAAREADSLQNQQENGTMQEARNSVKGKYWRPNLTQNEWSLLNRHMEQEINDPAHALGESTQWAYANEKGSQVFAIYGIGDGTEATPLYAVGGKRALIAYNNLMMQMEDAQNGLNKNKANPNFWATSVWSNQEYDRNDSDASGRQGAAAKGTNQLHVGTSEGNTEGAPGTGNRDGKVNRYSLKSVPAVHPESKDWRPGATFAEVKAAHPTLFELAADEADTRNPTQISGTVKSYRKIYDALEAEGFDGTILDASSGLGYGTRAGREEYGFHVDDIEPFPDSKYRPNYTDYSTLDKTYDVIISNAVLNVIPQDLRDAMVVKIGEMLNPGGRAFINVRGTDVKNAGSKVAINDDLMEYFISNTGSYQKGFTSKELVSYLRDALGDGFTVEPTRKFGAVSAIVTRNEARFSLKSPVEETKDLVALHNLTEDKLLKSIALGGFPMPSIAVTRQDIPHTNFGDITLVMDKGAIDPKASRKNTVYSADAWTPTVPRVEYETDTKAEQRITSKLDQLGEKLDKHFRDSLHHVSYGMDELLNRYDGEAGVIEHAMENYGMKAAFLEEQGQHIDPITKQVDEDPGYSESRVEKYENVAKVLGTRDPNEIGSMTMKEIRDQYGAELEQAFPGMTKSPLRMSGILNQVRAYLNAENGQVSYKTVTDTKAMERVVDEALDKPKYERWVRDLFSGLEGNSGVYNNKERFTPSGNRRSFQQTHYPATLEGITKAMVGQNGGDSRNVSGFYGVKSLRAGMAERFSDIADMHKAEGRLQNLDQGQLDKIQDNLNNRLFDLTSRIIETNPIGSYMQQADAVGNILMEIAEGKLHTIDEIERVFNKEYQYHVGNELAADVRNLLFDVSQMPVNMFEAKPERAVGFDEVLAAVVPDNASEKLVDALGEKGVRVIPYEAGNDTDRIQKVNSVEGARFSLKGTAIDKEYADLVKENRMLRERLDYWKGQTKLTKEVSIDKKSVERAAKGLLKTYESDLELSDVQGRLQSLYDYIARGYDGEDATYNEARRRAEALATDLIDNAVSRDTDMYDQYADLRQYLRDTKIVYGSEYKGDIPDFNDFRKRNFGRMRLGTEGNTNIDQVYQEMSSLWPEFFDEEAQAHPTDQLLRIDEVLSQLYEIHEGNPYSQYRTEAITDATNEIMETFFDPPQAKATFADKQAAKIAELRAQNRQNVKDAILAEQMAQGKEMAKLKRQYSEKSARTRESQTARELRGKIIRHANILSQKLLRPTDTQHIPENLRGAVAKLLASINQESADGARSFTADPVTKERVYAPKGTPTKRTEAFRELKEQYARIAAEGGDVVVDPSLFGDEGEGIKGGFDAVIAMGDEKLADMSAAQLKTVWQVLKAVEHSVTNAGKMLSATKYESTQQWADAFAKDASTRRPRSQRLRNLGLSLETPYTYFSQYGETGKALYRALRNAQDQQQIIVSHITEDVQKVVDSKTVKALEKSYQTYSFANANLTLTTAQVMDLYNLSRREQAKNHILKGGLVQPEVKSAKIGRGTEIIRITEGSLNQIISSLTPEQKKIAEGLQRISSTTLADYGNEASMTAYGYKKFTEPNYWPIRSAKEALHSNAEKSQANTRSIKNIGMAKPVVPNANTAVELDSVFRVFADHAADMTDYAAWLCTMEDVNRLFNYKYRDSKGNMTGQTMKGILDRVGGKGSQAYWSKLMNDIQNGINTKDFEPLTDLFSKSIGSFKGAAVGGNIRVIIQQPTAFFRAAAVLNPVDMAKGLATGVTKGNGWKKALQYSAIAMRKDAGGFDISSPYRMSETLFDTRSNVRKLNDTLSSAAAKADAVTWGALWNACEWTTLRENPNITKGSNAFYQRTAEHFAEMIDQTQVVDGVLQRSNVMRAKSEIGKQASSFMGEPIMSLNLLVRAYDQLRYTQDKKQRGKAIKTLGRSVTALVVTNAVNALAQSLVDAIRDDDPDKDYWERFWSAFTGISGDEESTWQKIWNSVMEGNFGGNMNMVAQVPYLKDALSLIQGYDVSRMDTEVMADVIQSAQAVIQNIDGSGKKTPGYALKELFAACAKVFGIPLANLSRDTWGAFRSVAADTGNIPMQYEMEKAIYNITNDSNKSRFLDILYRALEQGDMDSFEHIRKDLMERMGVDGKAIDSGLRSRYDKAAEKDPGYSLPEAARDLIGSRDPLYESPDVDTFGPEDLDNASYRSYAKQRASGYREMADNLETSPIFIGMSAESQENVMKAAYNLAEKTALEDNSNGQYEISSKWMQLADDAEEEGIEPWEYVLFHVAYSEMQGTKDKDGKTVKGESKGDHVREWLEDYDGFTEAQRRFLWETVYKSEW